MFGLELLAKLIKVLRSGDTPEKIAWGFCFGMILGLTPLLSLHNLIIILILIVVNVNLATAIFSFILFSAFAYLFDPLFHSFGYFLLVDLTSLRDFYTTISHSPIIGASRFNNTVVMGSLVVSIILFVPMYFLVKRGVLSYREKLEPKFQKLKIVQVIKGSKFYELYDKVNSWRS
ncbi:MAG: TIGR03546 family protein [Melioribacteraceae bacterium]|nr:TIGR03546 family protein [Melioribacteraceae bacterium]MCF8264076.1 TIGR03546 family protein [Melioribacteraceae bacterium]MCF8413302.1 TIGR03546 family protein [Melioribacteraceae bacterium]MCF8430845.1 TIGR03546 family protein [Melioribacteraceae bacterium]